MNINMHLILQINNYIDRDIKAHLESAFNVLESENGAKRTFLNSKIVRSPSTDGFDATQYSISK